MNQYDDMTEEELAEARIELDKQITALREEKKKIQAVINSRAKPLPPADHVIGGAND